MQQLLLSEATAARRRIPIHLVDATDGITKKTGETGGQPQLGKNGAAFANTSATLVETTDGFYYVELTAAELDTLGFGVVRYKSANTAEFQTAFQVVANSPYVAVVAPLDAAGTRAAIGLAAANLDTQLTAIDDFIDTEVSGIKTQTDKMVFTVANQLDVNVLDWKSAVAPAMTGDAFARLGAPAGASVSADVAAVKVDTAAVKVQTDKLAFTVANQIDANVLDWKSAVAPAMTGDAFARLGAPAGASTAADIAAVKVDTAAVKTKTDQLTFTAANVVDSNALRHGGALQTGGDLVALINTIDDFVDTEVAAILAAVDTEVAAILALLDNARAEPGQGIPPVNPDMATKVDYLYKWTRNQKDNDGSTTKFYADDAVTVDHKQSTSVAGGIVTKGEITSGP